MLKKWISSIHFLYFGGLLVLVPLIVRGSMRSGALSITDFVLVDIIWILFIVITIGMLWSKRIRILKAAVRDLQANTDDTVQTLCSIALAESYYSRSAMSPLAARSIDKISRSGHVVLGKETIILLNKVHTVVCWRYGYPKIVEQFEEYLDRLNSNDR